MITPTRAEKSVGPSVLSSAIRASRAPRLSAPVRVSIEAVSREAISSSRTIAAGSATQSITPSGRIRIGGSLRTAAASIAKAAPTITAAV